MSSEKSFQEEHRRTASDEAATVESVSEFPDVGAADCTGPEGLLFTGDAVNSLTAEQLAAIGDFAAQVFGVEMRPIRRAQQELGNQALLAAGEQAESEPEPIFLTKRDFQVWAADHGYGSRQPIMAFHSLWFTEGGYRAEPDPWPPLRFTDKFGEAGPAVDLRSVYDRLAATELKNDALVKSTPATVSLLAHLVNDLVRPEEPLPLSRAEWLQRERARGQR